jgi:hypothetical protein
MAKITVKHYTNTKKKPDYAGKFPIYVQICVNGQTVKMRSKIQTRIYSDKDLQKFEHEINEERIKILEIVNEEKTITNEESTNKNLK